MTKLKHIIVLLASVVAASLTSYVKEEAYVVNTTTLNVQLTRAAETDAQGNVSQEQGDGIEDAMLWVYKCSLDGDGKPTNIESTAAGWRYVTGLNTYGSMNVHIPLPMCSTDSPQQSYVIVALLNLEAFGTGHTTFNRSTPFTNGLTGIFVPLADGFWSTYPDDEGRTPELMPVSNWATFTVDNTNTHSNNCYQLELPVYRAVAKTQLLVRKSSDEFGLVITDAKICSSKMPNSAVIMTGQSLSGSAKPYADKKTPSMGAEGEGYPNQTDGWTYFQRSFTTLGAGERQILNNGGVGTSSFAATTVTNYIGDSDNETYTWVGGAFLYENDQELVNAEDYMSVPTGGNGGYYLKIDYIFNRDKSALINSNGSYNANAAGNEVVTRYVALPKVVRNHDYQIKATVEVTVTGGIIITYKVTDWSTQTVNVPSFN